MFLIFLKIFFGFRAEGREFIPGRGGFILACNHVSYLDPIALGVACRRSVHFMAKEGLLMHPLLRLWMRAVGVIPIKRDSADLSALKAGIRAAHNGEGVALFPEGTRRTPETAYLDPEPGVGFLAAKAAVPVVPAFVSGTQTALPKGAKKLAFCKITLRFGEQILIERGKPYQEITDLIMANIKRLAKENQTDN